MILKFKSPTTPSKRQLIQLNNTHLKKKPFIKKCLEGLKNSSGRNHSGKITIRHKGGGNKQKYRKVNFQRIDDSTGMVCSIEYDPNRNSHLASIFDFSLDFYYMLSPKNSDVGDIIKSGLEEGELKLGHSLPLHKIPIGSYLHSISHRPDKKAQLTRSAGTFSILIDRTETHIIMQLSSKKQIKISPECFGTIGVVSNGFNFLTQLGKAGSSRWLNKRPTVRGVAMNPVDHPNGGGEGKTSGKNKTPWGKSIGSKLTN